jgi:hypothetical protein
MKTSPFLSDHLTIELPLFLQYSSYVISASVERKSQLYQLVGAIIETETSD